MFLRSCLFLFILTGLFADPVTISGILQSTSGKPVKKAIITLRNLKNEILLESKSNRKGKFLFEGVEPNFYYLVVEHEKHGSKRIKINPRKTRNRDLVLRLTLSQTEEPVKSYLFSNNNPTDFDPILNVKELRVETSAEHLVVTWDEINQARTYVLFENGLEVLNDDLTRYEKKVQPGKEFCYTVQGLGDFGLKGEISAPVCGTAPTLPPRDITIDISKNELFLNWSSVNGASSYVLYRDGQKIGTTSDQTFLDPGLEFDQEYYYSITAINSFEQASTKSVEVKGKTREFIPAPILSSMKDIKKIMLIWNEIAVAKSYHVYRDGEFVSNIRASSFSDPMPPGQTYCYQIASLDQYGVESDLSNEHCQKVPIQTPIGVTADGDVHSIHLNWDSVDGAVYYKIYRISGDEAPVFIEKVKSTQLTIRELSYGNELCFKVSGIDMEGAEGELSSSVCAVVKEAPHFSIIKTRIIEPSGNGAIDSRENGKLQITIHNDGESPAHQVNISAKALSPDHTLQIGDPVIIDTLLPDNIEFVDIDFTAVLKVETGEHEFELFVNSNEEITLDAPYPFTIETKAVVPPRIIVADFAVSNDFGTNYIPQDETVNLTIRLQNVGEGITEYLKVTIPENRTFSLPGFTGQLSLPGLNAGEFTDIEIPIVSDKDNFTVVIEVTDYLDNQVTQKLNLELMKHYREPKDLVGQPMGATDVVLYPDALGDIDVDSQIPFGRKNPNAIAIILATERYDDSNYPDLNYANRDGIVIRQYFQNAFGLSDYQLLPSKTWQMEGGPTLNDLHNIFDPHQGDLRKRILTAEKYSGIESMDVFLYYRGYGEWIDGKPLLIPRDGKFTRHVTKYPLDQLAKNLSVLSVLGNIRSITLFLDITYVNPKKSAGTSWDYPDLPEKVCILSAASNGETSHIYPDMKHSIFTYSLLKGLAGGADDGDNVIELGELTEYVYRMVPELARIVPHSSRQNPSFNGMDLKRTILDLR